MSESMHLEVNRQALAAIADDTHILRCAPPRPPRSGFFGKVTFIYTIEDKFWDDTATVTLTIPEPSPVAAVDDFYVGQYNTPLVLAMPKSILANDGPASAGGKLEFVEVMVDVPAADGTLDWIRPNGTFHFTPTRGFRGNTTFTYRECQRTHMLGLMPAFAREWT